MGTWDVGPFDNDTAADFSGSLDEAPEAERPGIIRAALACTADTAGYLDQDVAVEAVAAAALVAAQCPGGEPVTTPYGPDLPVPELPADLRALAVRALDRVVTEPSELMELWEETAAPGPWRATVSRLRSALL
ncbi:MULTISPECIES: DUF4259 domain-containing protein [unclassified Streptomyces]|uniref:DUF4259 domain-containing protein n=1 Tax=unclassified Streptomyces TaxID=2593676 RepID=UPI00202F56EA|nr:MULTISPECIES: DUF4259 domain-containing protein [unclassified Streptomyces]MCM1972101.1 DUF4259 domain-containing protein [Streptomyces sp. G1]MCX5125505.1 DUF4259 domain-containing protein [Streptomyces sp. NBC_00347]